MQKKRQTRVHYGYWVMLMGLMTNLGAMGFARFTYSMILPEMSSRLGFTNTQMGLMATGNYVGYLLFSVVGGAMAAKYAPRVIIFLSMVLVGLSMVLTGVSGHFFVALAGRFFAGVGSGGSYVPTLALVSAWFAQKRRGMAAGFIQGGAGLGMIISGFGVPVISTFYGPEGWRYDWYYFGLGVLLLGLIGYLVNRNHPGELGLVPVGHTGGDYQMPAFGREALAAIYRNPTLRRLSVIYALWGFSYTIFLTFFSAYLIEGRDQTAAVAGLLFGLNGALSIFSALIWGIVSDRIGRKQGMAIVYFLQGCGILYYAMAHSYHGLLVAVILCGFTGFSIPGIVAAACGDYVGPRLAGAAIGFVNIFFGVGLLVGPALGGYLIDLTGAYTVTFMVATLVIFAGSLGALRLESPKVGKEQQSCE